MFLKYKKFIIPVLLVSALIVVGTSVYSRLSPNFSRSSINNASSIALESKHTVSIQGSTTTPSSTVQKFPSADGISYEVVTTSAEQEQGLGDRTNVPDNYGMLFVFPKDGTYGFWMKDMDVSLDMTWLSDNGTIESIDKNVSPETYPSVFYPPTPIKYVIETRAGFADEKNWKVGTRVQLPAPYNS